MKRILFGITSLTIGGAERVLVDLANELCDKYEVTIFTIYAKGELEKQLSRKVKLKSLYSNKYSELSNIKKKVIPLRILLDRKKIYQKYIEDNYDIEIAFLEGPVTRLFSVRNSNVQKIAWIHNDISLVFGSGLKSKIKQKLDGSVYNKFKNLIFVSEENMQNFNKTYENLKYINKKVIYNYIDKKNVINKSKEKIRTEIGKDSISFVTVARLVKQKAIDRLINVHNKLIMEGLKHHIYVIGDGPEKQYLEQLVDNYKLSSTFHLLGQKENPYPYIKEADYFCLLSEFEGYGMVIEEAKILNKPIIITNTAAREAIKGYKNGVITENTENSIYNILKEKILTGKNVQECSQDYNNEYIIEDIIKLIEN